jgi:glutamate:GABA antiporter
VAADGHLSPWWGRTNRRGALTSVLLLQAALGSVLALALRITRPDAPRPFKIPGGKPGLALVIGAGVVGALFTFVLGFIPATHLSVSGTIAYVGVMVLGMAAVIGTPFLLHRGSPQGVSRDADVQRTPQEVGAL